jgi:hypothetical protein
MIEREIEPAPRAHSGARKSKESAGKREATPRRIGTRGGTGAVRTGLQVPHDAALFGHVVPAGENLRRNNALTPLRRGRRSLIPERRLNFNDLPAPVSEIYAFSTAPPAAGGRRRATISATGSRGTP